MDVPLTTRIVEVIADRGVAGYRYGSGCIVAGRTVLTAAHVVAGAEKISVRDSGKVLRRAVLVAGPEAHGPDLALVRIEDESIDLPAMGLARLDRESTVDDGLLCRAIGYPWFSEPGAVRETVDAVGRIPLLSGLVTGRLTLHVADAPRGLSSSERELTGSAWSGMSGAPVVSSGRLLAVVAEHALREGQSTITAIPLAALEHDPAHPSWGPGVSDPARWWSLLGAGGLIDLAPLPSPPARPEPAYFAALREFGAGLRHRMPKLLGRERELAEINDFVAAGEGYRWLVGQAFSGKTALLYEVATEPPHDGVDVVSYFASRRAADADSHHFLAAVTPQLAFLCDVDPPAPGPYEFQSLWKQAAGRAEERRRPLLLIVDGLDEDLRPPAAPSIARLLPVLAGGWTHVLVSSRPSPGLPDDLPVGHPLCHVRPHRLPAFQGSEDLAAEARHELNSILRDGLDDLAIDVLGFLSAAAGPLSIADLGALHEGVRSPRARRLAQVDAFVTERAARTIERVTAGGHHAFQFAHDSFLEFAASTAYLDHDEFQERLDRWADSWRDAGWPGDTPRYLLDSYPATLRGDPPRLAALAGSVGWVSAAVQAAGADRVIAVLRTAITTMPDSPAIAGLLDALMDQRHFLQPVRPLREAGYVLRQLWPYLAARGLDGLAGAVRDRLTEVAPGTPAPLSTTRQIPAGLVAEIGRHPEGATALAVLPDGRLASAGYDYKLLVWNPREPGSDPLVVDDDLLCYVRLLAMPNGRLAGVSTDPAIYLLDPARPGDRKTVFPGPSSTNSLAHLADGRLAFAYGSWAPGIYVWDTASSQDEADYLGRQDGSFQDLSALPDGRFAVLTAGPEGVIAVWDPDRPGEGPDVLGSNADGRASTVVALPDGTVWTPLGFGHSHHALLRDGRIALNDPGTGRASIWDPAHPELDPIGLGPPDGGRRTAGVVIALAGSRFAVIGSTITIWDSDRPRDAPLTLGGLTALVSDAVALPDGRFVTADSDGRVLLWDPDRPGTRDFDGAVPHLGVRALIPLPHGEFAAERPDDFVIWSPLRPDTAPALMRSYTNVDDFVPLADHRVASLTTRGDVILRSTRQPEREAVVLTKHGHGVQKIAAMPDGRLAGIGRLGEVHLWDVDEPASPPSIVEYPQIGTDPQALADFPPSELPAIAALAGLSPEALQEVAGHATIDNVAVLPDGRIATTDSHHRLLVRRLAPESAVRELSGSLARTVRLLALPDNRLVSADNDGRLTFWDPDGAVPPISTDPLWSGIHECLVLMPDGRLAGLIGGGQIAVWDPTDPAREPKLLGREFWHARALVALPNGNLAAGYDDAVRIFDRTTHDVSVTLADTVRALAVSTGDDGRVVLAVATTGSMSFWSV